MTIPKFYETSPQEFAIKQSPSTDVDVGQFIKEKMNAKDSFASGVFVLEVIFSLFFCYRNSELLHQPSPLAPWCAI